MRAAELADELAIHIENNWDFADADCDGETTVVSDDEASFPALIDGHRWTIVVKRD